MKKAYHATRNVVGILTDGLVKPKRMSSVYLFVSRDDAVEFCIEFDYDCWVQVEYDPAHVLRAWKPSYAPKGVIRLKKGKTAKLVQ